MMNFDKDNVDPKVFKEWKDKRDASIQQFLNQQFPDNFDFKKNSEEVYGNYKKLSNELSNYFSMSSDVEERYSAIHADSFSLSVIGNDTQFISNLLHANGIDCDISSNANNPFVIFTYSLKERNASEDDFTSKLAEINAGKILVVITHVSVVDEDRMDLYKDVAKHKSNVIHLFYIDELFHAIKINHQGVDLSTLILDGEIGRAYDSIINILDDRGDDISHSSILGVINEYTKYDDILNAIKLEYTGFNDTQKEKFISLREVAMADVYDAVFYLSYAWVFMFRNYYSYALASSEVDNHTLAEFLKHNKIKSNDAISYVPDYYDIANRMIQNVLEGKTIQKDNVIGWIGQLQKAFGANIPLTNMMFDGMKSDSDSLLNQCLEFLFEMRVSELSITN